MCVSMSVTHCNSSTPHSEQIERDQNENESKWSVNSPIPYELIYQLGAIEYLFVYFQLDMFRAYTPIFRSNGCYNFFTYTAYGVLGVVRCRS